MRGKWRVEYLILRHKSHRRTLRSVLFRVLTSPEKPHVCSLGKIRYKESPNEGRPYGTTNLPRTVSGVGASRVKGELENIPSLRCGAGVCVSTYPVVHHVHKRLCFCVSPHGGHAASSEFNFSSEFVFSSALGPNGRTAGLFRVSRGGLGMQRASDGHMAH